MLPQPPKTPPWLPCQSAEPVCSWLTHSQKRRRPMRWLTFLRSIVYCLIALPAAGQSTFADARVDNLPTVFVTDRAGVETAGQLLDLNDNFVKIQTDSGDKT